MKISSLGRLFLVETIFLSLVIYGISTTEHSLLKQKQSVSKSQIDLVLSSGFLAFARHSGFLEAIDDASIQKYGRIVVDH